MLQQAAHVRASSNAMPAAAHQQEQESWKHHITATMTSSLSLTRSHLRHAALTNHLLFYNLIFNSCFKTSACSAFL